ncbi:MAG: hypothetical protein Kow0022_01610 [Phycisphaerales bacterium]
MPNPAAGSRVVRVPHPVPGRRGGRRKIGADTPVLRGVDRVRKDKRVVRPGIHAATFRLLVSWEVGRVEALGSGKEAGCTTGAERVSGPPASVEFEAQGTQMRQAAAALQR